MTTTFSPRVSVVMSVHNGEKYLREAIDSILSQTFTDFEFIIINDGSTDSSEHIIRSYDDQRIRSVTQEKNIGLPASLNIGFALARGEYLARMDADDISVPERLRTQVTFLDEHPTIGVAGGWAQVFGHEAPHIWKNPTNPDEVDALLLFSCCLLHPTTMIRRSILTKHHLRYNEQFTTAQDYELWSRVREVTQLTNIPRILLHYRTYAPGDSSAKKANQQHNSWQIQKNMLQELGILATETDRFLHQNSTPAASNQSDDFIREKEAWLLSLLEANLRTKIFKHTALHDIVLKIWLSAHNHSHITMRQRWRVLHSKLFSCNPKSIIAWLRLLLRGLTMRGSKACPEH